ncbi:bifunctional transcriptional activator/DNA repair enzyme AdaA [Vreelandella zhaodongensis]|uniref:Methylated-DNA--[protein]-cysteine S-methyltransferase n=1 Tax=Vreelandella zhaodongensis TaxID=1176240 RepID=A0ABX2SVW1_VREZH|nr:methylated-DNA--[protein]-cysteine S-methyltransferase [Halomonas zhaodongensis]NYS45628.1 methylated-DNA--[protein]-cysteine S-methyltransferase [Halomonas zhaodongensis]
MNDYARIEKAMAYMVANAASQPSLETVAAQVHLSAYHFQRLFCRFAGISPKRFLQALTLERGKQLIASSESLTNTVHELGLSGGSRLYDHFVQLEAVTPGEFKRQGEGLEIAYGVHPTPFGEMLVAMTPRGICRMAFVVSTSQEALLAQLAKQWPRSTLCHRPDTTRYAVEALFTTSTKTTCANHSPATLSLHVSGTNFQIAVWRALLTIPEGQLASYSQIAQALGTPKSSRAVGNAVGANPIALWIPCHRVIQQSGALGGYRWGIETKQQVQAWEAAQHSPLLEPH